MNTTLLRAEHISVRFPVRDGPRGRAELRAVESVSVSLNAGETLGIVGESGCGKSTFARALLRLVPLHSGSLEFEGWDYTKSSAADLLRLRRAVRMVFQDPMASLDPRMNISSIVREPLDIFEASLDARDKRDRVVQILQRVGLAPRLLDCYPHQLSGGQNQRVSIARALIGNPRLLICDESVSALDVSVQAQILNLLMDVQRDTGITLVFVSHDLSVIQHISQTVLVLYLGRVMEQGSSHSLFAAPRHPYTQALLAAVPVADPVIERNRVRPLLAGDPPSPIHPPSGCVFRTRCPRATPLCAITLPPWVATDQGGYACHHPL